MSHHSFATAGLVLLALLVPAAGLAQDAPLTPTVEPAAVAAGERLHLTLSDADAALSLVQQPPPPAPSRQDRRRRRPSMVGYVGDAVVQSQVRLRFDVGTGIDSPDRAEFFYAKCGCYRFLPASVAAFDPDAPGPGPGILTDLDFQQFYIQTEVALSPRFSIFGELPIRRIQPQAFLPGTGSFDDQSGISDLRAGVKFALVASDTQYLTLQLQGQFPTGDSLKGLGTDHASFEPALLFNQSVSDRVTFEAQFGAVLPSGGSNGIATASEKFAGKVLYYGIGPSIEVYRGDAVSFSPVVELVGWRVLDGFQTSTLSEADGVNIVNLKVGGRFDIRDRSSFYAGYGRALSDDAWYENIFRLEYRYSF